MEIHYQLKEEDYLNYNLFHIKNSKTTMNSLKRQRFLIPIFYLVFSIAYSFISNIPLLFTIIPFLLLSVLWIIFYPRYFYKRVIRGVKKMFREGKNSDLLGEHQMKMTDEGIVDKTEKGETKVNWKGIESFKENDQYFFLYNSSVSAYILPKRDIQNVEEIRSIFQSKLEN